MTAETTTDAAGVSLVERGVRPRAWLCEWPTAMGGGGFMTCDEQAAQHYMHKLADTDAGLVLVPLYEAPRWVPVSESLPESGRPVLACYRNALGSARRIRACWVAAKTEESGPESEIGEYDEATDTYYDPEGWYEQINNWDMYSAVAVHDGEITHWMPMPEPPPLVDTGPNVRAKRETPDDH